MTRSLRRVRQDISETLGILSFIASVVLYLNRKSIGLDDAAGDVEGTEAIIRFLVNAIPYWVPAVVGLMLFTQAIKLRREARATESKESEYERLQLEKEMERRRALISQWRAMLARVADWWTNDPILNMPYQYEQRDESDTLRAYIQSQPEYLTLSPYLKPWTRGNTDRTMVVDSPWHGQIHWLKENIERLEREWGLREITEETESEL